ncbi:MAG: 4-hydroxy-tetrahydrodipicolinate reductase [Deltaproteobacteria bacterium]|nr:4-hydroxy-tetrahydrodipicolinate reductase [Deltaproteobacteria bacterium]
MSSIVLVGASGRMGSQLEALIASSDDLEVVARVDAGQRLEEVVADRLVDCVIDFSVLDQVIPTLDWACERRVPVVLGTTGLEETHRAALHAAASVIPIVWAPNFSVGVNAMFAVASELVSLVGAGWDLELVDSHHRHKVDAPSGTARRLIELLAEARDATYESAARFGRQGLVGPRTEEEIGVNVLRGGSVVGTHEVHYLGEGEELVLTHRATDRAIFARGALRASRWLLGDPDRAPALYDMGDVLRYS